MPYEIVKAGKKYVVRKKGINKVLGRHASRKAAKDQIAAIYANENANRNPPKPLYTFFRGPPPALGQESNPELRIPPALLMPRTVTVDTTAPNVTLRTTGKRVEVRREVTEKLHQTISNVAHLEQQIKANKEYENGRG